MRDESKTARYLSLYRLGPGRKPPWLNKPAPHHFLPKDAKEMVDKDLRSLRNELNIREVVL